MVSDNLNLYLTFAYKPCFSSWNAPPKRNFGNLEQRLISLVLIILAILTNSRKWFLRMGLQLLKFMQHYHHLQIINPVYIINASKWTFCAYHSHPQILNYFQKLGQIVNFIVDKIVIKFMDKKLGKLILGRFLPV